MEGTTNGSFEKKLYLNQFSDGLASLENDMAEPFERNRDLKSRGKIPNTLGLPSYKYLKSIGKILLIMGFLIYGVSSKLWVLGAIITLIGAFLFWRGRQYETKAISKHAIRDPKYNVLYLRPFETDPSPSMLRNVFRVFMMDRIFTEEEQLREVLQPFGGLVAIGKPGESLPPPGAARLYPSNDEWKKVVIDLMETASLVILRAGMGEGLHWELMQARRVVNPKKLLILFIDTEKMSYEFFKKEADWIFKGTVPQFDEIKSAGGVSGFFRFSENWEPNFLPLRAPHFRGKFIKAKQVLFKYSLKPIFEEYRLKWQAPSVSISVIFATILGSLPFVFLVLLVLIVLLLFIVDVLHLS
jgi:hypothetical protein